jgi:hypothetical protein
MTSNHEGHNIFFWYRGAPQYFLDTVFYKHNADEKRYPVTIPFFCFFSLLQTDKKSKIP